MELIEVNNGDLIKFKLEAAQPARIFVAIQLFHRKITKRKVNDDERIFF